MDEVLQRYKEFSAAYLDDVVIFSPTWEQHLPQVRQILDRICSTDLTLNTQKCEWERFGPSLTKSKLSVTALDHEPRNRFDHFLAWLACIGVSFPSLQPSLLPGWVDLQTGLHSSQMEPRMWSSLYPYKVITLFLPWSSKPKPFLVQKASGVGLGAVLLQGKEGEQLLILLVANCNQERQGTPPLNESAWPSSWAWITALLSIRTNI